MSTKGYSVLEVLISLAIFGIVFAVMSPAFVSQLKGNHLSQLKMEAIQAANTIIDRKRLIDPTLMPTTGDDAAVVIPINNKNYSVVVSYCTTNTYCTSNTIRQLQVAVSYKNQNVFTTETVFTQLN